MKNVLNKAKKNKGKLVVAILVLTVVATIFLTGWRNNPQPADATYLNNPYQTDWEYNGEIYVYGDCIFIMNDDFTVDTSRI